jgi:hypothetical protein
MFVFCVVCSFMYPRLRRTDNSFRGVLPGVCVNCCDLETATMRRSLPHLGCGTIKETIKATELSEPHGQIYHQAHLKVRKIRFKRTKISPVI